MLKIYLLGLVVALLAGGCATQKPVQVNLRHYVLELNGDGQVVVNPTGADSLELGPGGRRNPPRTTAEYLDDMFANLGQGQGRGLRPPRHLIVFINGGLSGFRSSTGRARQILADSNGKFIVRQDTAFLFISWNSAGFSSYAEHLITHQGTVVPSNLANLPGRLLWGTLNLTADAGRTATSLPLLTFQYITQPGMWRAGLEPTNSLYTMKTVPQLTDSLSETQQVNVQANALYQQFERSQPLRRPESVGLGPGLRPQPDTALRIGLGTSVRRGSFLHFYVTPAVTLAPSLLPAFGLPWYTALGNTRLVGLVVTDLLGRPAWNTMLRRTQVMFVQPAPVVNVTSQLVPGPGTGSGQPSGKRPARLASQRTTARASKRVKTSRVQTIRGALPQFIDRLAAYQQQYSPHKPHSPADSAVTVTLIGHSMGTIVASEMLRESLGPGGPRLHCDAVVFMAAACTLLDVRDKVVPYLQADTATRFYNLTLHPYAELAENMLGSRKAIGGPILDGSLLVYLDRLLTNPLTPQERMAGRWHNFVLATTDASFIPAGVRSRVTLKAFGAGNRALAGPQVHGDFADALLGEKVKDPVTGRKKYQPYPYRFWSQAFREVSAP